MKDRVKEFLVWVAEDEQIALDNGGELIIEINNEIRALEFQRIAIESLLAHLRLKSHPGDIAPALVAVAPDERARLISLRAKMLASKGELKTITPQDVLKDLEKDYLELGVTHPTSVIATVLAASAEFSKVGKGKYKYIGSPTENEIGVAS